jgi:mannosyltransferase OCH1-like enzyme
MTHGAKLPVFGYWSDDDHSSLANFTREWSAEFPQFQVFGDREVVPLVARHFPGNVDLYRALRIPAAKADIARLLLLYEFGGLYIDCHFGIRNADEIRRLISLLERMELILVDRMQSLKPRPPGEHFVVNGVMFSRPRSDLIFMICRQAFVNLAQHREQERKMGKVRYGIFRLTGAPLVNATVLQPGSHNRNIRSDFEGRIVIVPEEVAPIERGRHRTYGGPGRHWSERQKFELLFEI